MAYKRTAARPGTSRVARLGSEENRQFLRTLFGGAPPLILLLVLMRMFDVSAYLTALAAIVLTTPLLYAAAANRQRTIYQFRTVSNLLEAMVQGDYAMRGRHGMGSDAYSELMDQINRLARTLSEQKLSVKESQLLLEKITARIDVAVLALNDQRQVTLVNPAAARLLGGSAEEIRTKTLDQLGLHSLLEPMDKQLRDLDLGANKGAFYVYTDTFLEGGKRHFLIFITDIQRILREEERKAWQNLVRVLSHEINNSLTPIVSISDTLARILKRQTPLDDGGEVLNGLSIIKERAHGLATFLERYKQIAKLPKPTKKTFNLNRMLAKLTALFPLRTIETPSDEGIELYADPDQVEHLLLNIMTNADEAMPDPTGVIAIQWRVSPEFAYILIQDEGVGVANPENLFVPLYTTKPGGSGIGLVLCRQIMFNHHGDLEIRNREDRRGAEVIVTFPYLGSKHRPLA